MSSQISAFGTGVRSWIRTQTQSNKAYYQFDEVDVDRYDRWQYRQVMLSGREMNPDAVPGEARNWINRHLVYTHGYGIVMSYATEITDEGFPCT